jgi:hypothetical protein
MLVDVASLVVAVVALVLAVAALYLTALRRADVEVDHVPAPNAVTGAPPAQTLVVVLFVSNTGVRGGVLRDLVFTSVGGAPSDTWTAIKTAGIQVGAERGLLPLVLAPGDGAMVTMTGRLTSGRADAEVPPKVLVGIRWTFVRTPGVFPRRLRRRKTVTRTAVLQIPLKSAGGGG